MYKLHVGFANPVGSTGVLGLIGRRVKWQAETNRRAIRKRERGKRCQAVIGVVLIELDCLVITDAGVWQHLNRSQ
jgi:hypothetical protein